jgi:peptide deformylase
VNPEIIAREGEESTEEGCLSVPGIFDQVKRAARIRLRAQDRTGAVSERDYEDILAVCIQHEMDHLDGKLFVDYLSDLKRERIRKKLDKERKERSARVAATAAGAHRAY